MNSYYYEKSKHYYEMYLQNKRIKKVCAIIKNKNKFLVLVKNGKACNVGGSVEAGEKNVQAVIREVKEEVGADVVETKYLGKDYYSVDWQFNNITFPSKRVEYFYLCKLAKTKAKVIGLLGEFEKKDTTAQWHTIKELEQLNLAKTELALIKMLKSN